MQIKWTELALEDLDQIEAHITDDNNASVAINVVLKIFDTVDDILSEYPEAGRSGRVKNTRELVINPLPYVVIYRVWSQQIEVLRVLHDAQEWVE